jgi:ABC-type thiamin/hydroxymethylpyrimidine transport system permease subunit
MKEITMRFTTRQLVLIAVFGSLWGVVEMSLGAVVKSLGLPFSGAVLAALGLTVALAGRAFVPRRGATLFTGVVAALLKLFSLGGVVLGPMIGILAEALIAELILSASARRDRPPGLLACLLAGAGGVVWTLFQPFATGAALYGRDLFVVWLDLLDSGARLLGLPASAGLWIAGLLAALHLALGAAAGWLGWSAARTLRGRMPEAAPAISP